MASSVEFTAGNANVTFNLVTSNILQVTLSNTSNMAATSENDVLTAVHFSSPLNLTPVTANVNSISNLLNCPACTNASIDISAEWAYQSSVSGLSLSGPVNLLSAADFGVMNLADRFGANNVAGTPGVGGIDFGIVGSGGVNSALTGSPLVSRQAVFYFQTSAGFNTNSIGNVGFLYGSGNYGWVNFDSGYYSLVGGTAPEPGSWLLMAMGVGALGWMRRRRQA
ncbi:MAG: PEP-CTERM sorting domain-containing protein [Bryobacterales bacterium]|nr:PEP-CTERM sorting domain-containing protein [Bryobacterales bacterium]